MSEQQLIQVRKLTMRDRKRLTGMIKKLAEGTENSNIFKMISSKITADDSEEKEEAANEEESIDSSMLAIAVSLFKPLLNVLEEETHDWFADLIGVDKEAFLDMPIDTELKIITELVKQEEASSFFTLASQLFKKMRKFQNLFS